MSKVFLISSNTMIEPYPAYPLGMAIVASALSLRGHKVSQFDFLAEARSHTRLQAAIQKFKPDYVGISLRNIDSADSFSAEKVWALASDREIVRTIKANTGAPVVLGGPAFSIMPEEILGYVGADYGIVGAGGVQFSDLIDRLNQGHEAPPISKGNGVSHNDDMSLRPLWSKKLTKYYTKHNGVIGIQTKRGCPHNCVYCTYPSLEGDRYIRREPGLVADDIEQLKKDHQITTIFFTDSVFNDTEDRYLAIAEELLRRGIAVEWSAFFRPDRIEGSDMELLKRSGLYAVEAGTDAAHDITLAGLNKCFSFDDVVHFNETCCDKEIPCVHYIMFGGPKETEKTIREGLDNITRLKNCVIFGFSGIRILPGAAIHKRAIEEGLVKEGDPLLESVFYFSPEIEPSHMNETIENAFKRERSWIFPPSAGQEMQKTMQRFGFHGPIWHKLVSFKKTRARR